jgi:putative transposase
LERSSAAGQSEGEILPTVLRPPSSLPGVRVSPVLERLAAERGAYAEALVVDNGPEFVGRALDAWAYQMGISLLFIRSGEPVENAFIESFNGRCRDECLNEHWFTSLRDAGA